MWLPACLFACMFVYQCVWGAVRVYILRVSVCPDVSRWMCVRVRGHVSLPVCMGVRACMPVRVCVCACGFVFASVIRRCVLSVGRCGGKCCNASELVPKSPTMYQTAGRWSRLNQSPLLPTCLPDPPQVHRGGSIKTAALSACHGPDCLYGRLPMCAFICLQGC